MKKFKEPNLKENLQARKTVAFIPVRGGSKGIPHKNIKMFNGQPLVYWTIKAAEECSHIEQVYVSTDSLEIAETVQGFGFNKVSVVKRSDKTATDNASTESAMLEFAALYNFDDIVLIQATSPLLESSDLNGGFYKYHQDSVDSIVSVVKQKRFIWERTESGFGKPLNYDPSSRPRRQEQDGYYVENGAFYITSRERLLDSGVRISGVIDIHEMSEDTYFEIDEPSDWIIAEALKKARENQSLYQHLDVKDINLLICDVDGVLTDAGMYYSSSGEELKKFNTKDGKGIEILRAAGIHVMFLTSENIELVRKRAEKLKIDYLFMGVTDKKGFLDTFYLEHSQFSYAKTAYIGDDINDLECLKLVKLSATPNDGHDSILQIAKYVCQANGGQGCVRELIDLILRGREL